jgi:dephospho-CoA kinase
MKIALVGKMRSGKDTVGNMLKDYGFKGVAFADGIKEIVNKYFPEALENGKPRKHYQFVGEQLRILNPNIWINNLDRAVSKMPYKDIVVTDCRTVLEANHLREQGYMIVKIHTTEKIRLARMVARGEELIPEQLNHITETQVDDISCSMLIVNDGTPEELFESVENLYMYCKMYFNPVKLWED